MSGVGSRAEVDYGETHVRLAAPKGDGRELDLYSKLFAALPYPSCPTRMVKKLKILINTSSIGGVFDRSA